MTISHIATRQDDIDEWPRHGMYGTSEHHAHKH